MKITKCKKCNQEITFIKMKKSGKSMPVTFRQFKNITEAKLFFETDIKFLVNNQGETVYLDPGYVPHWFNCTDPNHFSGSKKK